MVQRAPGVSSLVALLVNVDHDIAPALTAAGVSSLSVELHGGEIEGPAGVENIIAAARHADVSLGAVSLLVAADTGDAATAAASSLTELLGIALIGSAASGVVPLTSLDTPGEAALLNLWNQPGGASVASVVAAWAGTLLTTIPALETGPPDSETSDERDLTTVVHTSTAASYTTTVQADHHQLVIDEPATLGGNDRGPTPYDMVAAALGACTGITLRMYADRKKWPLDRVDVTVTHSRIHAEDDARCEDDEDARLDHLQRTITVHGALDESQRARLLEIADMCPVHRTLERGLVIETSAGSA